MTEHTPLPPRDLLILAVLVGGRSHGYGIIKAVEAETDGEVRLDPANLYRALRRMGRDGWIEAVEEDEGGDRRRFYEITARGRTILRAEVERVERLLARVRPRLAGPARGAL